jgi:hypothetical protein
MTEPPRRYDITITADRDGGIPHPAGFAVTAQQAASARGAVIVSAHTAGQIICVVTIRAWDRSAAALAVVSEALRRPVASLAYRPGTCASSALIVRARAFRASVDPLTPPLRNARRVTGCPAAASLRATTRA